MPINSICAPSYLEQGLAALSHVLRKHWCVESLCFILQQPALVPGLVRCQIFEVWPSVALWGKQTHRDRKYGSIHQCLPLGTFPRMTTLGKFFSLFPTSMNTRELVYLLKKRVYSQIIVAINRECNIS